MNPLAALFLLGTATLAHAADVTVIRPSSIVAQEWSYYILVGGDRPITDVRSGEHASFRVPAGQAALVVHCPVMGSGAYEESRLDYAFGDGPAFFVIEPAPHCVRIQAVDAARGAAQKGRTRERALRPIDYEMPVQPPKPAKDAAPAPSAVAAAPVLAPAAPASREAISAATAAWVEAFNSRDPARLSALYDAEAVLLDLDTRSPLSGSAAISQHYAGVSRRPTARLALGERSIRILGETAIDSGTATVFEMRDGSATTTPVRYSVTYRNRGGKWLIIDHQLSPAPR